MDDREVWWKERLQGKHMAGRNSGNLIWAWVTERFHVSCTSLRFRIFQKIDVLVFAFEFPQRAYEQPFSTMGISNRHAYQYHPMTPTLFQQMVPSSWVSEATKLPANSD